MGFTGYQRAPSHFEPGLRHLTKYLDFEDGSVGGTSRFANHVSYVSPSTAAGCAPSSRHQRKVGSENLAKMPSPGSERASASSYRPRHFARQFLIALAQIVEAQRVVPTGWERR
ncbi:hypothetical protein GN244_ATG06360 [Phytophthora infestans]|uniref:Uncharacterized protein n=1 Tax=Phytophthora infestans TaxID=4787 RepID=A0A833T0E0_PHYIN|nr:hypothetical protein GN244_ATG06360 [Phytophthora infestans]